MNDYRDNLLMFENKAEYPLSPCGLQLQVFITSDRLFCLYGLIISGCVSRVHFFILIGGNNH